MTRARLGSDAPMMALSETVLVICVVRGSHP